MLRRLLRIWRALTAADIEVRARRHIDTVWIVKDERAWQRIEERERALQAAEIAHVQAYLDHYEETH